MATQNTLVSQTTPTAVLTKTVTPTGALPGDTVTYTLTFQNQSPYDFDTVDLSDTLPTGLTLVPNSITPAPTDEQTLPTGISVGPVKAGGSATLSFQATVDSGVNSPLTNLASADYTYTNNGQSVREVTASNASVLNVPQANPTFTKTVSPTTVQPNGVLHYTLTLTNPSSVPLNQVVVKDTSLPSSMTVQNLQLNGTAVPSGQNLSDGVQVGTLAASGGTATITFDAAVPQNATSPLNNAAVSNYSYTVSGNTYNGQTTSNTASAVIAQSSLSVTKTADKAIVNACGDTVMYTVTVTNTGNVSLNNVTVTDPLPQGMTYLANSTVVNGGAAANQDPQTGISVGTLAPGQSATVQFGVTVNCL